MARSKPQELEQLGARPGVAGSVTLHWIPLGAGARSVRFNGIVYEAVAAAVEQRSRCRLYHSALEIALPTGRFTVEMTPVPDEPGDRRGVVAGGPVGVRAAGRLRLFRYEVRRWRDGIVPDLAYAVASPVVTRDPATAQRVFALLPSVPTPTWGRDELRAGEIWSCNSITAWVLAQAGVDMEAIPFPARARVRSGYTPSSTYLCHEKETAVKSASPVRRMHRSRHRSHHR
jgi:hypothetical protein